MENKEINCKEPTVRELVEKMSDLNTHLKGKGNGEIKLEGN